MTPRRLAAVCFVAVAMVMLVSRLPPVRTVALTAVLVPEMIELPVRPLSWFGREPTRRTTTYGSVEDRMDVYIPPGASAMRPRPAVVLGLGVHTVPIDHADIVRIATAIARVGVVAAVPDSTALRSLDVGRREPAHLADAVLVTARLPEVMPGRVGLAGFSAGASLALVAAADPRLEGTLSFVSAFGGYADAERLLVDVATRTTIAADVVEPWQPDAGIRRDLFEIFVGRLPPGERDELRMLLEPVVTADDRPGGPDPAVADRLTGDSRVAYLLFSAATREAAHDALAMGSAGLRHDLAAISPLVFADRIDVPVFVIHGEPDTAIPVEHAALLEAGIGEEIVRVTRFGGFGHEQPGSAGLGLDDAGDIWELSLYLRDIVATATE